MRQIKGWAAVLALGLATLAGCSGPAEPVKNVKAHDEPSEERDPLQVALPELHQAHSAADYRSAVQPLDSVLQRNPVRLSTGERELLLKRFNLSGDELAEVEADFFRPLDGSYLEECFLLRDSGRALRQPHVSPLEQAEICLDWVCRQVLLRGYADLIPPSFVLRQGHGDVRERALVFLALLNQLRIAGCIISWPEAGAGGQHTILAGVLAGSPETIYLFDPRLGKPLPSTSGKGIGTLADLRKNPALVSLTKEEAATRPSVLFACPLTALAPRMRFLEKRLLGQEQVVLAVEPAKALARLEKAAGAPVSVWNPPATAERAASNSPTRMLRHFVPAADGGIGTDRWRLWQAQAIGSQVVSGLVAFRLYGTQALLRSTEAQNRVLARATELFRPYDTEARGFLLRGQYEKAVKRLDMIASAYDDLEFAPINPQTFGQEIRDWCARADQVHLAHVRKLPKSQEMLDHLWQEDEYFLTLLEAQRKPNPQKQRKTVLTPAILSAVKSSLGADVHYLQAQTWQEQAERARASGARLAAVGDAGRAASLHREAQEYWVNAAGLWRKCLERYCFDWTQLPARLRPVRDLTRRNDLSNATAVWNNLLNDITRAAAARWNLARALEQQGKQDEAVYRLTELVQSLKDLRDNPELQQEVAEFSSRAGTARVSKEFVESLTRDLGPKGSFDTLAENARSRLRALKGRP